MRTWRVQTCDGCHKYPRLLNLCLHSRNQHFMKARSMLISRSFVRGMPRLKLSADLVMQAQGANRRDWRKQQRNCILSCSLVCAFLFKQ